MNTLSNDASDESISNPAQPNKGKSSFSRELWSWIKSFLAALIIVLFIHQFVFSLATVKGHSMEPTLRNGEWLFVNEIVKYVGAYHVGNVIICKDPDLNDIKHEFLVKRIVAVAGDTVEIKSGKLYVNGLQKNESYVDISIEDGNFGPIKVEQGRYFVMGDNRHHSASKDSRYFGSVPAKMIEGRVEVILWPLREIRWIDRKNES